VNTFAHFIELRSRIIRCGIVIILLFSALFTIDKQLYTFIATPLLKQLPVGSHLIATEVTTPFMVPMKLALVMAILLGAPFIFYQLWSFIAPGLYPHEKKRVYPLIGASLLLFYSGILFAYFVICPLALGFFAKSAPINVTMMTDMKAYLDFVLTVLFAGGIAFQVPVLTVALVRFNIVSASYLAHLRPYVIVAAFTVGMLLTPPDVVSQILLALPMWGLFEVSLFIAKRPS
jgi:sec-independent protein translocase protein TatC